MTDHELEKFAYLESAVIDRERRIFGLASIIRTLYKKYEIPLDVTLDFNLTEEEAKALGIKDWLQAKRDRPGPG